jgi:cytochrome b
VIGGQIRVWHPAVRILHWTLAASVFVAFATHEWVGLTHEIAGYVASAAAALRIGWGFAGTGHARFADFVRTPAQTLSYLKSVLARREPRFIGHNPLGGWMIVALLANVAVCSVSGWLLTTTKFWGSETVERIHAISGELFVPMVLLHIAGVAYASWRHRENLVAAMIHGEKRAD